MELKFFELLGYIQMKLTKSNVEASFEKMKDHLLEFDVTAEFVDIDYNYYGHTELMGPVVTFKTNKPDMDWFVQVSVEKDFPMLVGVIRVS